VRRALVTASRGSWAPGTVYAAGDTVTTAPRVFFRCTTPGTSGGVAPSWPPEPGGVVVGDGTVEWQEDSDSFTVTLLFTPIDEVQWKSVTTTRTITVEGGEDARPDRYMLVGRISADADAEPFDYENENLGPEDLAYIMAQLRATSGLWQWEVACVGVNIPWVRRGSIVAFTGLEDAEGRAIPVPPALMHSLALSYEEGVSVTKDMKALAWTAD
jgi:hypothetical protein